jgi:hypothetical protein
MDVSIIAALIGALGSIAAGAITPVIAAASGRQGEAGYPPNRRRWRLVLVVIALIALAVGVLIISVLYDGTRQRLSEALPARQGFRQVIYEKVGLGFLLPSHWEVDDASFRFGGGDIDLIRDHDPTAASISQGIKLRLINVQETYVNNPEAEYDNELAVLEGIDPHASVRDVQLAGRSGKTFVYKQHAGERPNYVQRTWIRVVPRVKLEVLSVSNLDEKARQAFSAERDDILKSLIIDGKKTAKLAEM